MCKIVAAVVCSKLSSLFLLQGAPRNFLAAEAKMQDDRMAFGLNTSGSYFTTK
ncbi:hypothetical protein [Sporosarcina sp. NPDC096371]|uniref:hypothetical protein n=1 Tax=Sporosarcina sp. NPDC096371 TaxID=3364530 RepID=UPI0038068C7B